MCPNSFFESCAFKAVLIKGTTVNFGYTIHKCLLTMPNTCDMENMIHNIGIYGDNRRLLPY